jgi:hypothetical protein
MRKLPVSASMSYRRRRTHFVNLGNAGRNFHLPSPRDVTPFPVLRTGAPRGIGIVRVLIIGIVLAVLWWIFG